MISNSTNQKVHKLPNNPFQYHIRENPFATRVLIGNWFEERFASEIDPKAVAPAIYGKSQCAHEQTFYKHDFQPPTQTEHQREINEFVNRKQECFSNRWNSEESNIKLWDGKPFADNFCTMTDMLYRLKPQQERTPFIRKPLGKRRADEDYMQSVGNITKTGLLTWKKCEMEMENGRPSDETHYQNEFQPPLGV